jgi:hypothetical protein
MIKIAKFIEKIFFFYFSKFVQKIYTKTGRSKIRLYQ